MKEIWSFGMNNMALYNDSKIIRIWFALKPKKLGLGAFNRKIY